MSTATQSLRPLMERTRHAWRTSPLPGFLQWWGGELINLLPVRWRTWFGSGASWHLLEQVGEVWTLRRAGHPALLADWDDTVEPRAPAVTLARALQNVDREDLRLALLLPAAVVLRRTLVLPLAARANLAQVVAFEIDRQTPFAAAQVHYAVRPLGTPAPTGRFHAELVAVPRATLDPLLARARALSLSIDAVDLAVGDGRLGVNLLPEEQIPHHARPRRRLNLVLAGIVVLLLALLLGQWLHNRQEALAQMQQQVDGMHAEAQQVASLRQQLQDNAGAAGFLAQRKKETVSMLSLLRDVTERLPGDAWLERFSVDNSGQVGFQGQSQQATKLLDALKDSPVVTNARFQGSIQPDPTSGKERFYLTAKVRPSADSDPGAAR